MVVIEVAGPPGAGKTTLLPTIMRACEAAGLRPYTVTDAARICAGRSAAGRATRLLPARLRGRALWGLYYGGSLVAALRLARARPALARYVLATQRGRPAAADARQRRVVYWYLRSAGSYAFLRCRGRRDEALVIDEGFVHRALQLHASTVERPWPAQIAAYVGLLPATDLVVAVHAPVEVCLRRVHARGAWPRLAHRQAAEIDRFVANGHRAVELAAEAARHAGRALVEVDNGGRLQVAQAQLYERLCQALGAGDAGARQRLTRRVAASPPPRPTLWLPRATRIGNAVAARVRPAAVDPGTCAAVLGHYGLAATRDPRGLPFGARNANVVVRTQAGTKVLRRHRASAQMASVRHEHAVLAELERLGFPAVRLARTLDGDTVVRHDGAVYALFDHEDARNLSSCYLRRADRRQLLDTAGRTLARLHRDLAGFAPATPHHLGYRARDGRRTHDLAWHLDALADLAGRRPPGGADPRSEVLRDKRPALAADLARLDEVLAAAALPQVMIHGDYGIHNLLFRRDGAAVVTDFELARREWRLIDLVIVLARVRPDCAQAFLDSYRREADIAASEWRHLTAVWQYHRLSGAVQSWRNYVTYGGAQRLDTAVERLRQAESLDGEAMVAWR